MRLTLHSSLFILYSSAALLLGACHDLAKVDSKGIKREMEQRTVYRITDTQLLQGAQTVGDRLSARFDSVIQAGKAKPWGWVPGVNEVMKRYALPMGIEGGLVDFDSIPTFYQGATKKQRKVLEAMLYSHQQGQPVGPNIQQLENKTFQYIRPVQVSDSATLRSLMPYTAPGAFKPGTQYCLYHFIIPSRPAALEASKGMKGMK